MRTNRLGRLLVLASVTILVFLFVSHYLGNRQTPPADGKPAVINGEKSVSQVNGEKAVAQLKREGSYDSLQAAMAAARYGVYEDPRRAGGFYANNAAQGLTARFADGAAELTAETENQAPQRFQMRFTGAGYGVNFATPTAKPTLKASRDRSVFLHKLPSADIEEWYVNRPGGLEHGFTLPAPPAGRANAGERLRLEMALDSETPATLQPDGKGLAFAAEQGRALAYRGLKVTDATGRELSSRMTLAGAKLAFEIDDAAAAYPVVIDPTWQETKKITVAGAASDQFGFSVSISGDVALVGANKVNVGAQADQGAAYVFQRNSGGANNWGLIKQLTASDGLAGDEFGYSVALDADTLVVGAPLDDPSSGGVFTFGAAYVFQRNFGGADNWGQVRKLTASDGAANDQLGSTVAIDGDTILLGAYAVSGFRGAVYVYERNFGGADNWGESKKINGPNGATLDFFGVSVGLDVDTAIIGADGEAGSTGAAYILARNQGGPNNWGQVKKLTGGATNDNFGEDVAISGDYAVAGAYNHSNAGGTAGAAYIFARNQGGADNWGQAALLTRNGVPQFGRYVALDNETALIGSSGNFAAVFERNEGGADNWGVVSSLVASDVAGGDAFGASVALSGGTALAGAYSDDVGANANQGSAYIFDKTCDVWAQLAKPVASDGASDDRFGEAIAIEGGYAVVGAPFDDVGANSNQGSAYLFARNQGGAEGWGQVKILRGSDSLAADGFGASVAVENDTVVVGAASHDVGANSNQGAVYVFQRNQGGADNWGQVKKIIASDGLAVDLLGASVAVSGNFIVAGARQDDFPGAGNQGSAYIFDRHQGGANNWGEVKKITAGAANDEFGTAISISGETILAGAPLDDVGANANQGSAYIFQRNQGGAGNWGQVAQLNSGDGAANDNFGAAVSVNKDTALVGAHLHDVGANTDQGAAYLFARDTGGANNWGQAKILNAADGAGGDNFGRGVGLRDELAAIGAPAKDVGANSNQGTAYIFAYNEGGAGNWGQDGQLFAADGAANDLFGRAVGISDGAVIVGASETGSGGTGLAYLFNCCPNIVFQSSTLADATLNFPYAASISASGGAFPLTYAVTAGALPGGLNLAPNGQLTGTPIVSGTFNFTVTATNSKGCAASQAYTLMVDPPYTWNGSVNNAWHNASNWTPNGIPGAGDVAIIPASGYTFGCANFTGPVTVLNLMVSGGLSLFQGLTVTGALIHDGGNLNVTTNSFNVASYQSTGGAVIFDGGSGATVPPLPYYNLTISGSSTKTATGDITVGNNLRLFGVLNMAGYTLAVTNCNAAAVNYDFAFPYYVIGKLRRCVAPGSTYNFPIGTTGAFSEVVLTNIGGTGNLAISSTAAAHPNLPQTDKLNRYWTIDSDGGVTQTDIRFYYRPSEVVGTEANYKVHRIEPGPVVTNLGGAINTSNTIRHNALITGVTQFSDWTLAGPLGPTAAGVNIDGQVRAAEGRLIRGALVRLTEFDNSGSRQKTYTDDAGRFRFEGVAAGRFYLFEVWHKRYQFSPRLIFVGTDLAGVDFTADSSRFGPLLKSAGRADNTNSKWD